MEKIIAFCGIVCSDYQAFIATQEDNDEKKERNCQSLVNSRIHAKA